MLYDFVFAAASHICMKVSYLLSKKYKNQKGLRSTAFRLPLGFAISTMLDCAVEQKNRKFQITAIENVQLVKFQNPVLVLFLSQLTHNSNTLHQSQNITNSSKYGASFFLFSLSALVSLAHTTETTQQPAKHNKRGNRRIHQIMAGSFCL